MTSTIEKGEKNQVKLTISIDADAFEKAVQEAYLKNRGRISVPGFRKGKAHLRKDHHQAEQQAKNFFAPVALSLFHADPSSPRFFWFFIFYYLSFIKTDL